MYSNRFYLMLVFQNTVSSTDYSEANDTHYGKRCIDMDTLEHEHTPKRSCFYNIENLEDPDDSLYSNYKACGQSYNIIKMRKRSSQHVKSNEDPFHNTKRINNSHKAMINSEQNLKPIVNNTFDTYNKNLNRNSQNSLIRQEILGQTNVSSDKETDQIILSECSDSDDFSDLHRSPLKGLGFEETQFICRQLEQLINDPNINENNICEHPSFAKTYETQTCLQTSNNYNPSYLVNSKEFNTTDTATSSFYTDYHENVSHHIQPTFKTSSEHVENVLDNTDCTEEGDNHLDILKIKQTIDQNCICYFENNYNHLEMETDNKTPTCNALQNIYVDTIFELSKMGYKHILALSDHLDQALHSEGLSFMSRVKELQSILNTDGPGDRIIKISNIPFIETKPIVYIASNDTHNFIKADESSKHTENITQSHFDYYDTLKYNYLSFMYKMCLEYNKDLGFYVLKRELWGVHAYMAEFYFYIMWKIKKITDFKFKESANDDLIISNLQNETIVIGDMIRLYSDIYQSSTDKQTVSVELKELIDEFRITIYEYLKKVYPETTESIFYHIALKTNYHRLDDGCFNTYEKTNDRSSYSYYEQIYNESKPNDRKVNFTCLIENQTQQNMIFIFAFTFHCSKHHVLILENGKRWYLYQKKNSAPVYFSVFLNTLYFQKKFINNVLNIINFIKYIRNSEKNKEEVLLIYPNRHKIFVFYINTSDQFRYELRILTHSYALYFYSEYIRNLMW